MAPGLIGSPSGKRHIHTYHPETEVTRSMSKLPRHTAIASCQPKQSTKMSMSSDRQTRHPARRRQLRSHPRHLPSRPRQLRLTLQSPQPFRQRFLPSRDSALTAAFAAFENAMALYRRWPRRRGVGLFHIHEMETESGDCRAARVLSAFGLGRSAETSSESVHQLRVIFSSQCICRPGPARD